ncbi:MAG: YbaB/EbfC family nucleoid-associated protein, partial [Methylophilaceae bacterium]
MKGGMNNMMKQAQMMQANMQKAQEELASVEIEGIASNGLVKVTMTCRNEVRRINIDESV